MAAIPETAGVARTDGEGAIDIPGDVEKVLLVDSSFTNKKELVRHCKASFLGRQTPDDKTTRK